MAPRCDAIVVIGSSNSSNTRALERLAIESGCAVVLRINRADELPSNLSGVIGVTAGASAPEELVDEVLSILDPRNGIEEVRVTEEDEYFPPPRNIRELQAATLSTCYTMLGVPAAQRFASRDHDIEASTVLHALATTKGSKR
jgi:4-hydroxy-3-methylbut-2-enyl diphosphate reductase